MESREQRIATLATTLRSSGIAKSDAQAKMMAEDMIGVEEHVQRDYEVEHTKAHEYLQTAKNLGTPRQTIKPESKVEPKVDVKSQTREEPTRKIEELYTTRPKTTPITKRESDAEYTGVSFGGKTLNQAVSHDTHNSALEAIKAQISSQELSPKLNSMEDIGLENIQPELEVKSEVKPEVISELSSESSEPRLSIDLDELKVQDDLAKDTSDEPVVSEVNELVDIPKQAIEEKPVIESVAKETVVETPSEEPKLDSQKLIDMMEEDGKLEEHTREIKEKPKDVKPKEAYEENNIDLSSMFDFNKGMVRK